MIPLLAAAIPLLTSAMQTGSGIFQEKQKRKEIEEEAKRRAQELAFQNISNAWSNFAPGERNQIGQMLTGFNNILL